MHAAASASKPAVKDPVESLTAPSTYEREAAEVGEEVPEAADQAGRAHAEHLHRHREQRPEVQLQEDRVDGDHRQQRGERVRAAAPASSPSRRRASR